MVLVSVGWVSVSHWGPFCPKSGDSTYKTKVSYQIDLCCEKRRLFNIFHYLYMSKISAPGCVVGQWRTTHVRGCTVKFGPADKNLGQCNLVHREKGFGGLNFASWSIYQDSRTVSPFLHTCSNKKELMFHAQSTCLRILLSPRKRKLLRGSHTSSKQPC